MSVPVREVRRDDNSNRALRRIVRNHRGFEKTIKDALEHCARGGPSPTSGRTPGLEGKPEDRPRLPWNRKRRRRRQYATAIMNLSLRCCSVSSGTPNLRQSRNFATRCGDWKSWSHQATALGPDEWIEPAKRWRRHSVCLLRACWRARTAALPVSRSTRPLKRGSIPACPSQPGGEGRRRLPNGVGMSRADLAALACVRGRGVSSSSAPSQSRMANHCHIANPEHRKLRLLPDRQTGRESFRWPAAKAEGTLQNTGRIVRSTNAGRTNPGWRRGQPAGRSSLSGPGSVLDRFPRLPIVRRSTDRKARS